MDAPIDRVERRAAARRRDADRRPMTADGRAAGGRWTHRPASDAARRLDYAFVLDGGEPPCPTRAAPGSRTACTAPSRTFDPARLRLDRRRAGAGRVRAQACSAAVVYELHVGTFTPEGTLDAAIARLDHLVDLGVDVVELMPVAAFAGPLGLGLRRRRPRMRCTTATAARPPSSASSTPATPAASASASTSSTTTSAPSGNYLAALRPVLHRRRTTPRGGRRSTSTHEGCARVRRSLVDNALRWFRDFHVDALRLDAVHELRDDSQPHLLAELSDEVAALADDARPPARPRRRERPQRHRRW